MGFNEVKSEEISKYTIRNVCSGISGGAKGKKSSKLVKIDKIIGQINEEDQKIDDLLNKLSTVKEGTKEAYNIEREINKLNEKKKNKIEKFVSVTDKFSNISTKYSVERRVENNSIMYSEGELKKEKSKVSMVSSMISQAKDNEYSKIEDVKRRIEQAHIRNKADEIDKKEQEKVVAENEKKGREDYYLGRQLKEKVYNEKEQVKGDIDYEGQLAVEKYGNTGRAYVETKNNTKDLNKRLDELEGR